MTAALGRAAGDGMTAERIVQLGITEDQGRDAPSELRARITHDMVPIDDLGAVGEAAAITVFRLPFYENVEMVVASDPSWTPAEALIVWLLHEDGLYRLDGSSHPIHMVNAAARMRLDAMRVLAYLRFFCFFVRADLGPFLVLDRGKNAFLPEASRAMLAPDLVAPEVLGQDHRDIWQVATLLHYGTAMFAARFSITPSGMIEMDEDHPLIEDLPAMVTAPLSLGDEGA